MQFRGRDIKKQEKSAKLCRRFITFAYMKRFKHNRIKEAMQYLGWSAQDLADNVGISIRNAYYLQKPEHEPTSSMLMNICEKMNIAPEELIILEDEEG